LGIALRLLYILVILFPPLAAARDLAGNNAALQSMATQARSVVRLRFATPGDGGGQVLTLGTGAQIISDSGHNVTILGTRTNDVVTPSSYKMPSDPDDSNSIIAALATCKSVEFAANTTYTISKPLPLCPGGKQKIFGHGASSVIKLAATYDVMQVAACADAYGKVWRVVFYNFNCGGPTITYVDSKIKYNDFTIDASSATDAIQGTIGILNRNVNAVDVHHMICIHLGDCTAMVSSINTLVADSIAYDNGISGFDHWESPVNASVVNTTVYCSSVFNPLGGYGLTFNATDTDHHPSGVGINYTAINNKQFGCVNAVFIDPLVTGASIENISVINNIADGLNVHANFGGITISGLVKNGKIVSPLFRDFASTAGNVMYVGPSQQAGGVDNGQPVNIGIIDPTFLRTVVTVGGVAPLRLLGSATNYATGVNISSSVTYPYAVDVDTGGTVIQGTLPPGSVGLATVHRTYPQITNTIRGQSLRRGRPRRAAR
jgi:hypothetical protein